MKTAGRQQDKTEQPRSVGGVKAFLVTHLGAGLVAFLLGRFSGGRSSSRHCENVCRVKNNNGPTPQDNRVTVTLLARRDVEDRLATGIPWIEKGAAHSNESILLFRPSISKSCQTVNLVWLQSPSHQDECLVVLPHSSSKSTSSWVHHVRRLAPSKTSQSDQIRWNIKPWEHSVLENRKPFRLETAPKPVVLRDSWTALQHYFSHLPRMLETLTTLIAEVHGDNVAKRKRKDGPPLTILLSNKGHVDLLVNFVCAWRSVSSLSKTDVSLDHILVFAIDRGTASVASKLGLNVFYYPDWLGMEEAETAAFYGTHSYAILMLAKIYCAHMMSVLGHDFIFHDVDIVPLQPDYLAPLLARKDEGYDMYFQYDFPGTGSVDQMQPEYRPLFVNSGLYFVRANVKTRHFFDAFVRQADLVLRSTSHQVVMTTLIGEHTSSHGLRIKVLREEADLLPGGFHFHHRKSFMQQLLNGSMATDVRGQGESDSKMPYLFHMNYNENKETKKKFNQQIGSWYISDSCSDGFYPSISLEQCCVVEPEPKCFFRDKPSKRSCMDSPFLEGNESFW